MAAYERQSFIPSISELSNETQQQYDQDNAYASAQQAFYDQTLVTFVSDEVHAMMQIMCCRSRWFANFYNPFYAIIFGILYILTLPGAVLHYWTMSCVPVRYSEYPEERELRSQGIYTALGIALYSIPAAAVSMILDGDEEQQLISIASLIVNICIVFLNLIALKAVADGLRSTVRVYIITVWAIAAVLVALTLFDVYTDYEYISWYDFFDFALRILEIFVYTVIGAQCTSFWDLYTSESSQPTKKAKLRDYTLAAFAAIIALVILLNFIVVIAVTEDNAWRLLY